MAASTTSFVPYADDIEKISHDEAETVEAIVASMTHESEITADCYKHAVRASHAKSHGLLKGEMTVFGSIPDA